MRFVRLYIDVGTGEIIGCAEQDEPFGSDVIVADRVRGVCLGIADPLLWREDSSAVEWARKNLQASPAGEIIVSATVQPAIHRCSTFEADFVEHAAALPERVKTHLRDRWRSREDLSLKHFRAIGFSALEIKQLPKFAALLEKVVRRQEEKRRAAQMAAAQESKLELVKNRLARRLRAKNKKGNS
jgi:hypothetical protein